MSKNRSILSDLEEKLLHGLANATGSLLDNDELIAVLEDTKTKSTLIAETITKGEETELVIEEARQVYIPVALRGSILFFAMSSLSTVSKMYEYSLTAYLEVFKKSLSQSRQDSIVENRLRNIIEKHTSNVYDYTCLSIFEEHKLMFTF